MFWCSGLLFWPLYCVLILRFSRLTDLREETFHSCQGVGGRWYFIMSLLWRIYVKSKMFIFKLTEYSNVESFALLLHFSFSLITSTHSISESLLSLAYLVVLFCLLSLHLYLVISSFPYPIPLGIPHQKLLLAQTVILSPGPRASFWVGRTCRLKN